MWTWINTIFFSYTPIVYAGIFFAIFLTWAMFRTRWGLRLRALGEHPRAADTVGINVVRGRWFAVLISGFMAGLAGANLSLEQVGGFSDSMTNGRGFIALAANIFGRWIPGGAYLASLLFGFADALQLKLQLFSDVIRDPAAVLPDAAVPAHGHRAGGRGRARSGAGGARQAVQGQGLAPSRVPPIRRSAHGAFRIGAGGPVLVLLLGGVVRF